MANRGAPRRSSGRRFPYGKKSGRDHSGSKLHSGSNRLAAPRNDRSRSHSHALTTARLPGCGSWSARSSRCARLLRSSRTRCQNLVEEATCLGSG